MRLLVVSLSVVAGLSLCVSAGGCSGSVGGPVSGDGVPGMSSGIMMNATISFFGLSSADTVRALWTSFGDGCAFEAEDLRLALKDGSARDREDLYKQRTPADWWSTQIDITAPDADKADGATLDLSGGNSDKISFTLVICHNRDFPREKNNQLVFDQDCFPATNGDVDIGYDRKAGLQASGPKIDLQDSDGHDAGRVSFSGSASFCADGDNEFERLFP